MRPRSYNGLLMSFLILIIVYPLVQYLEGSGWMLEVALVAVLVFAINAVTGDRYGVRMILFLGLPAVVGRLLAVVWDQPPTIVVALLATGVLNRFQVPDMLTLKSSSTVSV